MLHARLGEPRRALHVGDDQLRLAVLDPRGQFAALPPAVEQGGAAARHQYAEIGNAPRIGIAHGEADRSEEHTSELQSLMRISYAVFCLKKKKKQTPTYIADSTSKHNNN